MTYIDFLKTLSQPAQRALVNAKITDFETLSQWSDKQLLQLHGLGPSSLPKIHQACVEFQQKRR